MPLWRTRLVVVATMLLLLAALLGGSLHGFYLDW
jgi:hypothetical protein